jgi:hypothetical protein
MRLEVSMTRLAMLLSSYLSEHMLSYRKEEYRKDLFNAYDTSKDLNQISENIFTQCRKVNVYVFNMK